MAKEIERKYLVTGDFKQYATKSEKVTQAYLSSLPERSVRIRIIADKAYLTIKGITERNGLSRFEWEKEIEVGEAMLLLPLCEPGTIEKTRYYVPENNGLVFEVDEFIGENEGLLLAEIELPAEDHVFDEPAWLGKEVTGQSRYYNATLKEKPFSNWE